MRDNHFYLISPKRQKPQHRPIVGMVVLDDQQPSEQTISTVIDTILPALDPKNRSILEDVRRSVLASLSSQGD